MKPTADYYAEQSSLQLRVNMVDEAIASAKECIRLAPDYSDGYLFLGLSLIEKKNKEEGIKNLKKAKELGDTQADALIEKYSK
jgi:tetratricopeptide (TPR) repeat protein